MVVLDPGTPERHGRDGVWCDPCLVPLVQALNDGGVRTVTSCCGHTAGKGVGGIGLADGRWLVIVPDDATFERAALAARGDAAPTVTAEQAWDEGFIAGAQDTMATFVEDAENPYRTVTP